MADWLSQIYGLQKRMISATWYSPIRRMFNLRMLTNEKPWNTHVCKHCDDNPAEFGELCSIVESLQASPSFTTNETSVGSIYYLFLQFNSFLRQRAAIPKAFTYGWSQARSSFDVLYCDAKLAN